MAGYTVTVGEDAPIEVAVGRDLDDRETSRQFVDGSGWRYERDEGGRLVTAEAVDASGAPLAKRTWAWQSGGAVLDVDDASGGVEPIASTHSGGPSRPAV